MLDEARDNAAKAGVEATFGHSIKGEHDLIHSVLVFQHIPPKRGLLLVRGLLNILRPRGVAVLHFVYKTDKRPLVTMMNLLRYRIPILHYATNVLRRRPVFDPPMQMNAYPLAALFELFAGLTIYIERIEQRDYPSFLFYARKP